MDIPSSMLSFLAQNQPPSPGTDDPLMFIFSSPTTEVDDSHLQAKAPTLTTPAQPILLSSRQNAAAQIDSLLAATSPAPSLYDPSIVHQSQLDFLQPPTTDIKTEPLAACPTLSASHTNSCANSRDSLTTPRRSNKRKRTLPVMKALARNNAPDVSLTDAELLEIGCMHESDAQLSQSKELYTSLATFKKCLAKHGYRVTALQMESNPASVDENLSFDLVLSKKLKGEKKEAQNAPLAPQQPSPSAPTPTEGDGNDIGKVATRLSFSNSSETTSPQHTPAVTDEERPRKRARVSQRGESSTSGQQRLACAVCSKLMSDFDTLVRHFRHAHQELKPFSCPRCRGFYSSEGTLWHHIRNVHTETPRKYKCSHCDASYDSFGAKTRHEHATHNTGTPQFVCSFKDCNREFNFPAHLESHALQMHPGFRPFACDACGKSFPSANGLTRHCREVHVRPQAYSCSCSKSYSKRCHLKRHLLRVHGMSEERVREEMDKQPHPGLLHLMPPGPPACTE